MQAKYDKIGAGYNVTRRADPYLTQRLLHHLQPIGEGLYLDIGCGTGNYTIALQTRGFHFIGIDPSGEMLGKAKQKSNRISWRIGTAEETGLEPESISGIMATLTIHHWADLKAGFKELYRVLKPGGNIVLFTATPAQMEGYWLNYYFPEMLRASINQMPAFEQVESAMQAAGFKIAATETYFVQPDLQDLFLYSGKHNPTLYFNEAVRNGISSFSSLANKEEVKAGLTKLKNDIDTVQVVQVIKSFENNRGDYLFITGRK